MNRSAALPCRARQAWQPTPAPLGYPDEIPLWEIMDSRRPSRVSARQPELRPGDRVAVHFLFRGRDKHGLFRQNELVWLVVRGACEHGYVGALEENPAHSQALRAGDVVEFDPPQVSFAQRAPRFRSRVHRLTRRRRAVSSERLQARG